jgi:hypothetical protein
VDRSSLETLMGLLAFATLVGLGIAKQSQRGLNKLGLLSQELVRKDRLPPIEDQIKDQREQN